MASETVAVPWWQNLTACCNTCVTRKIGSLIPESSKSLTNSRRVVVLGSPECGKSRILSLISDSNGTSTSYKATNGTATTRLQHGDLSMGFVEVGGSLRGFWSRTVDAKVSCVWYLLTRGEFDGRDFATLSAFFNEASTTINTHRIPIVVSVLEGSGLNVGDVENVIMAAVSDCGVFVTPSITMVGSFEKSSLIPSVDVVASKLAN